MRLRNNVAWLAIAALMLATVSPAAAANKDMIQLQTQVQALQDQVARMQQSIDMNMGVMKNLIEQSDGKGVSAPASSFASQTKCAPILPGAYPKNAIHGHLAAHRSCCTAGPAPAAQALGLPSAEGLR